MFSALVNHGEWVVLPSGRTGVVIGRGEGHRCVVLPDDATDKNDTVEIAAALLKRKAGPQPFERQDPAEIISAVYRGDI